MTNTLDPLGWSLNNKGFCIGMLIVYCVITNFLAYISLTVRRDDFLVLVNFYECCNNAFNSLYLLFNPSYMKRASAATVYVSDSTSDKRQPQLMLSQQKSHSDITTKHIDSFDIDEAATIYTVEDQMIANHA